MLSVIRTAFMMSALIAWSSSLVAQPMRQSAMEKPPEILTFEPETEAVKKAVVALRERIKAMHIAEIRFHNSDSVPDESRFKKEWFEIRESVHQLHIDLLHEALKEYLTNPSSKDELGRVLFKALKRNAEKDNFDGMLPIAKGLYENNFPEPELHKIFAQCCFAENEYDLASSILADINHSQDQFAQMMKQLEIHSKNWKEEQEARKRDAAGEPLPQARIVTTKGDIIVELFENEAPEAVASFISLVEKGFYDYLDFFLVIQHLAAQAGCPNEDGTGGPGYMIKDEHENPNARKIFRGSLVLATLKDRPNSGGSQFYIPLLPPMEENTKQIAFGRVISGMHNIATFNRVDPKKKEEEDKEDSEPKLPADEIIRIEIIRKRNHPYEPTRLPFAG